MRPNSQNGFYNPNQNSNFSVPSNQEQHMSNKPNKMPNKPHMPNNSQISANQQMPQQQGIYNPADMNQLFNDPMAKMAVNYGSSLAGQGKEYVTQNV